MGHFFLWKYNFQSKTSQCGTGISKKAEKRSFWEFDIQAFLNWIDFEEYNARFYKPPWPIPL